MPMNSGSELQRRKKLRLQTRPNLKITLQNGGGDPCFVLKDPVTLRYFHLDQTQRYLIGMMDGTSTLDEIRRAYEAKHRPHRMPLEELEAFARQLLEGGLVVNEAPAAAQQAIEQSRKERRRRWLNRLNIFYFRLPLGKPDRWLTLCSEKSRIHNTALACILVLSALLFLGAVGLLATHWQDFCARLPSWHDFFSWQNVFVIWLTFGIVKVFHELGHAVCCKRLGAEVQEIGILFLFFFPTLYCNVSDSWTLTSKWRRIAVSAAGIVVELVIASLATFLWWLSDSHTLLHQLCFALMSVCTVPTVLYNANPLMRFDGYFVFSDLLAIPNLAQQASQTLGSALLRCLGVEARQGVSKHGSLLFWYGLAGLLYRCYFTALTFYFLFEFLKHHRLAALGSLLVGVGFITLIAVPVFQFCRRLHRLGRFQEMKRHRVGLLFGVGVLLVATVFVVPFSRKVRGTALVQAGPEQMRRVVIPQGGAFLSKLRVRDGQHVKAGEVLALLDNPKLKIKMRLNEADRALRFQQQHGFVSHFADLTGSGNEAPSEWQQCEHEIRALGQEQRTLQEECDALVLRAPIDGVIMGLPSPEEQGKWLDKGFELCRIADRESLRALVLVDPGEHAELRTGAAAQIHIHGLAGRNTIGFVSAIAQVEASKIPPALSSRIAGEVATKYDSASQTDKPHGQHYLVSVQIGAADFAIHPGVLGQVRIEAEARTLWWRLRRYLGTTFNWGL